MKRSFTVTVQDATFKRITELCDLYDCSKSKLFAELVRVEHAKITSDPKTLKALQLLHDFRNSLGALVDEFDEDGSEDGSEDGDGSTEV